MSATDRQPGDNRQLERGMDAASTQRTEQHDEIMSIVNALEIKQDEHAKQMVAGDVRMKSIETKLDGNNAATEEVLDILRLGKSFFRLAGIFGSLVKWTALVGAPLITFWYTLKGGKQ